jgi:hypothetical protein
MGSSLRVWIALTAVFTAAATLTAAESRLTVFDLHAEDDARSRLRLLDGAARVEVDPREPWALIPRILPGPADAWAGGTQHSLTLPLGLRRHRSLELYIFLDNASQPTLPIWQDRHEAIAGSPTPHGSTRLAVAVNDAPLTVIEIPGATERDSPTAERHVIRWKIDIPARALGDASTARLSLINQSGSAVVLERMRLVEARPTLARSNLGRRGRFPPESAALLAASLVLLILWNAVEATGRPAGRRLAALSASALALLLLGVAELMPPDRFLAAAVPRWAWLVLSWVVLLACRPPRATAPGATATPGSSPRVEPARTIPRRAALIVLYLLAVVLFLEGTSRGALSIVGLRLRLANYDQDAWWRLQWIERKGDDISIFYSFDEYHPARGWSLRPDVRNAGDFEHGVVVNSNALGIRGRREYLLQKPVGVTRVLVFGDSFTFGDEVSDDATYAAQLEQLLPRTEVLNLGVHGYAHDQMLLYLEEVGTDYHPDVVLLGFVAADMERNLRSFRDFAKPRFELAGAQLILRDTPVPRPEEVLARERYRSRFVDLLLLLSDEARSPAAASEAEKRDRLTAAILDEFRRTVAQVGATPIFVYMPLQEELETKRGLTTTGEGFFLQYCRDRGVGAVDLRPTFLARLGAGTEYMPHGHFSPQGHRIAAEAIAAALAERRLVPHPAIATVPDVGRSAAQREAPSS